MTLSATNLLTPFRRDKKQDFASGQGSELLRCKVLQTLLTQGASQRSAGDLPWRTAFGAGLELLRHQRNDAVLEELARVQVRDALRRWLPAVRVVSLSTERNGATLEVRLRVGSDGSAAGDEDVRFNLSE